MKAQRNYSDDARRRMAHARGFNTHCGRGHEYTPENTYLARRGTGQEMRQCQACRAIARAQRMTLAPPPPSERDPAQVRRMVATWLDPDVTGSDFAERFGPSVHELTALRSEHGAKASWLTQPNKGAAK